MSQDEDAARPAGRPTKCTPALTKQWAKEVSLGVPMRHAAALCGVTYSAVKEWLRKGREGVEPYDRFLLAHEHARAKAIKAHTGNIVRAALGNEKEGIKGDPKWSAWLLQKWAPEDYGDKVEVEVTKKVFKVVAPRPVARLDEIPPDVEDTEGE